MPWRVIVELTFDIDEDKDVEDYMGDTEKDVANRAFERVRPLLDNAVSQKGDKFRHYHILETPKKCLDV
jgi:hypothetical protein